jgi:hypothetical protein
VCRVGVYAVMLRSLVCTGSLFLMFGCRASEPLPRNAPAGSPAPGSARSVSGAPSREFRCAQLEYEIQGQFEAFLARHRACKGSEDCTLARTDCPLGCHDVAVSKASAGKAKTVSDGLLELFEGQECGCVYKCAAPESAACVDGQCVARLPAGERPG